MDLILNWTDIYLGPPETLALAVFSLVVVAYVSGENLAKGSLSALLGVCIATVGTEPMSGVQRFDFGFWQLWSGIDQSVFILGAFGLGTFFATIMGKLEYRKRTSLLSLFWPFVPLLALSFFLMDSLLSFQLGTFIPLAVSWISAFQVGVLLLILFLWKKKIGFSQVNFSWRVPLVVVPTIVAVLALRNSPVDVLLACCFAAGAIVLTKLGYSTIAVLVGLSLGKTLEICLMLSAQITNYSFHAYLSRPSSFIVMILAIALVLLEIRYKLSVTIKRYFAG
jgi:TctA family transporter